MSVVDKPKEEKSASCQFNKNICSILWYCDLSVNGWRLKSLAWSYLPVLNSNILTLLDSFEPSHVMIRQTGVLRHNPMCQLFVSGTKPTTDSHSDLQGCTDTSTNIGIRTSVEYSTCTCKNKQHIRCTLGALSFWICKEKLYQLVNQMNQSAFRSYCNQEREFIFNWHKHICFLLTYDIFLTKTLHPITPAPASSNKF